MALFFSKNFMFETEGKILKIILIGDTGAGKTSLLTRFAEDTFNNFFIPTIGVDFRTRDITIDGEQVKLHLWDTAGQEKFRSITKSYFRGSNGILVVFDLSKRKSFDETKFWIQNAKEILGDTADMLLIGNKCDLERDVEMEEAEELADSHNIRYFETSAKNNINVNEAFNFLVSESLINQKCETASKSSSHKSLFVEDKKTDNLLDLLKIK